MENENKTPKVYPSVLGFRLTMDVSVAAHLGKVEPNSICETGHGVATVHVKYGDLEQIKEAISKLEEV